MEARLVGLDKSNARFRGTEIGTTSPQFGEGKPIVDVTVSINKEVWFSMGSPTTIHVDTGGRCSL